MIVTALALHAFRAEAAPTQGNYYVKITDFPSFATDATKGKQLGPKISAPKPFILNGVSYKLESKIEITPSYVKDPYLRQIWDITIVSSAILSK